MGQETPIQNTRVLSFDILRGLVMMIIMLLDHTRDFVRAGALQSDPINPATRDVTADRGCSYTTKVLFYSRDRGRQILI